MKKKLGLVLIILIIAAIPFSPRFFTPHDVFGMSKVPFWNDTHKNTRLSLEKLLSHLRLNNCSKADMSVTQHTTNELRDSIGLTIGFSGHADPSTRTLTVEWALVTMPTKLEVIP